MEASSNKPPTFHTQSRLLGADEQRESVIHGFYLSHNKHVFTVAGMEETGCDIIRAAAAESNDGTFSNTPPFVVLVL